MINQLRIEFLHSNRKKMSWCVLQVVAITIQLSTSAAPEDFNSRAITTHVAMPRPTIVVSASAAPEDFNSRGTRTRVAVPGPTIVFLTSSAPEDFKSRGTTTPVAVPGPTTVVSTCAAMDTCSTVVVAAREPSFTTDVI